ncbi:hypothetical protein KW510_02750 [Vibrio fluvialis]|nr:hypothetical protein [Vibrio fluvialis]
MFRYDDLVAISQERRKKDNEWRIELINAAIKIISDYAASLNIPSHLIKEFIDVDTAYLKSDEAINEHLQLEAKFSITLKDGYVELDTININFLIRNNTDGISYHKPDGTDEWISSDVDFVEELVDVTVKSISMSNYELS